MKTAHIWLMTVPLMHENLPSAVLINMLALTKESFCKLFQCIHSHIHAIILKYVTSDVFRTSLGLVPSLGVTRQLLQCEG